MKVYPAVDILDGRCVQLVQGIRQSATTYGDPLFWATRWLEEGAERLHIINLNGAFGESQKNVEQIHSLIENTGVEIQLGGGIRSIADAEGWLSEGVTRIILGTLAITNPDSIRILAKAHGGHAVMAGVDAKGGQIVVRGWQEPAGDYITWAQRFEALGAGSLLFTNVDVEGLQKGIDPEPVRRLVQNTGLPVTVAGGISSLDDICTLKSIGISGVVLGSALYSGKLDLKEVLEECR
jgi:phosphoribosylformimino-5-aminoimidazole carboxamide ribotide isomerase